MRLLRYFSAKFFTLAVTATLILAAIAEVLDLVDNAGDILDRGDGLAGLGQYLALRTPTLIAHALPLGALAGAVMTLGMLARNSEIVAARASGRSTWDLYVLMFPGAFVLGILHCVLLDAVLPKTEQRLAVWWAEGPAPKIDADKPAWLRLGPDVISFDALADRGRRLTNLQVYERNADKVATGRLTAREARYENRRWTLAGATHVSWLKESFNVRTPADGVWETRFRPSDAVASLTPGGMVSSAAAQATLQGERVSNAPASFYETLILRVYAAPLSAAIMLLLAMPAAFINWRDARSARYGFLGLGLGLAFLLSDGLLTTLGGTGVIPPAVGSWTSIIVFAALGGAMISRMERGMTRPRARRATPALSPEPHR
ncbi:hypothetical protein GCM10008171_22850 [Methylopila jiangsuensis]|uniref:LPS export ABC transporter permease LptG n=1 Tax=Methylopila jiangsuensis TaxID=586230 RepID=A0A9W6JII9_9HYPH|nr:LptF/LptG family permease [Methylopila jiangsuensis]MDR6286627.1 lipopolysaccharide export system permease protein [Methylopila jiangsuensis]GLK77031.1 hypothetical protein GCM10008171_22850 [Methylopila jiangsuensis]